MWWWVLLLYFATFVSTIFLIEIFIVMWWDCLVSGRLRFINVLSFIPILGFILILEHFRLNLTYTCIICSLIWVSKPALNNHKGRVSGVCNVLRWALRKFKTFVLWIALCAIRCGRLNGTDLFKATCPDAATTSALSIVLNPMVGFPALTTHRLTSIASWVALHGMLRFASCIFSQYCGGKKDTTQCDSKYEFFDHVWKISEINIIIKWLEKNSYINVYSIKNL